MPPAVSSVSSEDIEDQDPNFIVTSHDSGENYLISTSDLPSCNCLDFQYRKWPCKHLLALWKLKPENNSLKNYFSQPLFTLDNDIFRDTDVQEPNSDTPVPSQQEQILTEAKARKMCLEILGQIESSIYNAGDVSLQVETSSRLEEIHKYLQENSIMAGGLPVRKKLKWRRTSLIRKIKMKYAPRASKKRNKTKLESKPVPQQQPDASLQSPPVHMQEDDLNEKALLEIWNQPPDDFPVLQVGPFSVTRRSFHYIKTTLSDDVIDASLAIILKQRNILHIDCITATAIFHGQQDIHHNLCQVNLNMYDACIGVVYESGGHWVLVIIEPVKKTVTYSNPFRELHGTCAKFLQFWYDFLTSRYMCGYEENPPEGWTLKTVPHARQIDGTSCGVYVIKFAENYVEGRSYMFKWNFTDLVKARRMIAYRLLSAGFVQPESAEEEVRTNEEVRGEKEVRQGEDRAEEEDRVEEDRSKQEDAYVEELRIDEVQPEHALTREQERSEMSFDDKMPSPVFRRSRRNPKPKRKSSFVYCSTKKMKRKRYCMCNKPEDGKLYWQCEGCGNWLHPECIGLSADEEPEHFFCDACKPIEEPDDKNKEEPVVAKKVNVQVFISSWESITRFLEHVAGCTDEECSEPDHSRHHCFVNQTQSFINEERHLFGFGTGVFEEEVIEWLQESLMTLVQYDLHPVRPATSAGIATLLNIPKTSKLYWLFSNYNLTASYIQFVLLKELLLHHLTSLQMMPYEHAEEICKRTEFNGKKLFK